MRRAILATLLAITLAFAACGDDGPRPSQRPAAGGPSTSDDGAIAGFRAQAPWQTDFSKRAVPFSEIIRGGPTRDGIPPIDRPQFETAQRVDWLADDEPVVALTHRGETRAYPIQILMWHEVVNDVVGEAPVVVTFCPLCNTAIAFDRALDGVVYDFGVSGLLRHSDLIMWDRQTQSWWQQATGEAIVGALAGKQLKFLAAAIVPWGQFRDAHSDALVLSRDTGHSRPYGDNPYVGYDAIGQSPFLYEGRLDERLQAMERVVAVDVGGETAAYPFSLLAERLVVEDTVGGERIVVLYDPGAKSPLDAPSIRGSREIGAAAVYRPTLDGRELRFERRGDDIVDIATGSVWNVLGRAKAGPLRGQALEPVVHGNHFWFAWAAFRPATRVYGRP